MVNVRGVGVINISRGHSWHWSSLWLWWWWMFLWLDGWAMWMTLEVVWSIVKWVGSSSQCMHQDEWSRANSPVSPRPPIKLAMHPYNIIGPKRWCGSLLKVEAPDIRTYFGCSNAMWAIHNDWRTKHEVVGGWAWMGVSPLLWLRWLRWVRWSALNVRVYCHRVGCVWKLYRSQLLNNK